MSSSPLPSIPLRQTVLVQRIREAEQQGHWYNSELLRSQLVHRYGIAALADVDRQPEMLSKDPVVPPVQDGPASSESVVAALAPKEQNLEQPTGLLERVNAKLRSTRRPLVEASTATPPLSTPRSLRRWLPGTDGDVDRQAS